MNFQPTPGEPLVEIRGLTKAYPGIVSLKDFTVDIPSGVTGLLGPNGAGKTSLMRILVGLTQPTDGSVEVLGLDPVVHQQQLHRIVGYMPEHRCSPDDVSPVHLLHQLAAMSGIPSSATRERTAEALDVVGLDEARYRPIGGFSTGMKQRVKLAQALLHGPKLLVLDEPTNGLDRSGQSDFAAIVNRATNDLGVSIIMSSHVLDHLENLCDWVLYIEGGELHRSAPMSELVAAAPSLVVDVGQDPRHLITNLASRGISAVAERERVALVDLSGASDDAVIETHKQVVAAVAELKLPLTQLGRRRHGLAELFAERPTLTSSGQNARGVLQPARRRQRRDIGGLAPTFSPLSRWPVFFKLTRLDLADAFGAGRRMQLKLAVFGTAALVGFLGLLRALIGVIGRVPPEDFLDFALWPWQVVFTVLFIAIVVADVVQTDNPEVLNLKFVRPIKRFDYSLARQASITCAAFLVFAAAQVLIFVGDWSGAADSTAWLTANWMDAFRIVLISALVAVYLVAISLAVGRRAERGSIGLVNILGVHLIPYVTGVFLLNGSVELAGLVVAISPIHLVNEVAAIIYGGSNTMAVAAEIGNDVPVPAVILLAFLHTAVATRMIVRRYGSMVS